MENQIKLKTKHFLTGEELSSEELESILKQAIFLKQKRRQNTLENKTLALLFEKPSLRTRVSFTIAIQELSGQVVELNASQKKSETPEDTIRVLQGYVDGVMIRTFDHSVLEEMTKQAEIPVINGLSDLHHPCQVLADLQTLMEVFGYLKGLKLAYVGDGNNMLHSLLLMAPSMGIDVHFSCPESYGPNKDILKRALNRAQKSGAQIKCFTEPKEAVQGVNAVYTDVWTSMGFEGSLKAEDKIKIFSNYQLNSELYSYTAEGALIMHCMPINEGEEITREMIEHPRAVMFQQSQNRLHAQKALLMGLYNLNNNVKTNYYEQ